MPQTDRPMGYRMPDPKVQTGLGAALNGKDVSITIGAADSEAVQNAGAAAGVQFSTLPDGSVVVDLAPQAEQTGTSTDDSFGKNLAEVISDQNLGSIAAEVIEGVNADETSRSAWIATYRDNIDLLGLKIESAGSSTSSQSVSKVRHPVLLESVVKFQAGAGAELLPAAGPAKVQVSTDDTDQEDTTAKDFERDFNYYLTKVATEFYPDTDRMHFYLGYGGCAFKKVFICPMRERPVSEAVYMPDLIVSYDATDLQNAQRVTHVLRFTRGDAKRMMIVGAWKDIELIMPPSQPTTIQTKEGEVSGVRPDSPRAQDALHVFYECSVELDLLPYGIRNKGAPKGMPLPYRIVVEKNTQQVVEVRRDWRQGDKLFRRRKHFVKYGLVPGFGFYDLGFLHLIGNQTKALTAIWRILVDAGMFNNFPGGVRVKGTRQTSNVIMPNPGEWPEIDTGPITDIRQALMPLPYKEPSAVLVKLAEIIGQDAQRMGSAVEMEVGEGRTNMPVGTIMAQIEQQTQVMQAVHKRLHRSQAEELQMIRDLFIEEPAMLTKFSKDPKRIWKLAEEFSDLNLVPASDPNVPAQIHRIMLAVALTMLSAQSQLYDQYKVQKRVLSMINISNPDELLIDPAKAGPGAAPPPDSKIVAQQLKNQNNLEVAGIKGQQQQQADATKTALAAGEARENAEDRATERSVEALKAQSEGVRAEVDHSVASADMAEKSTQGAHDRAMDVAGHGLDVAAHQHEKQTDQHASALDETKTAHDMTMDHKKHALDQSSALMGQGGLGAPSI